MIVSGDKRHSRDGLIPRLGRSQREGNSNLLRQFLGRLISPKEGRGVWVSPREDRGLEFSSRRKGQFFFFSPTFLSLSKDYISESEVIQSCPTLCNPMDCRLPGSSVHGILKARVLEWVAISFSRGSSRPSDRTWVSCIVGRHFSIWATREVFYLRTVSLLKPSTNPVILKCILWEWAW